LTVASTTVVVLLVAFTLAVALLVAFTLAFTEVFFYIAAVAFWEALTAIF